jgi:hypothetical protein
LKNFHFFDSCVRLTRKGGTGSCTCGQKWYSACTNCRKCIAGMVVVGGGVPESASFGKCGAGGLTIFFTTTGKLY